jgi:hypothetical protein
LAIDAFGISGAVSIAAYFVALAVRAEGIAGIAAHAVAAIDAGRIRTAVSVPACLVTLAVHCQDFARIAASAFVSKTFLVSGTVALSACHMAQAVAP